MGQDDEMQTELRDKVWAHVNDCGMQHQTAWFHLKGNTFLHEDTDKCLPTVSSHRQKMLVEVTYWMCLLPFLPNALLPDFYTMRASTGLQKCLTKPLYEHLQKRGIAVGAIGVNNDNSVNACNALGLDFMISDDPNGFAEGFLKDQ